MSSHFVHILFELDYPLSESAAMTDIIYRFSSDDVNKCVEEITMVVDHRLARLNGLIAQMKQSGSARELVEVIKSSGLVSCDDFARSARLSYDTRTLFRESYAEVMLQVSKLTAVDLCRCSWKLMFTTHSDIDYDDVFRKYLATLDDYTSQRFSWCIIVSRFAAITCGAVTRITPSLPRWWPRGIPISRGGKNDALMINVPIGTDHFGACEQLLTELAYYGVLSMYPYCRMIAVQPGYTATISDITAANESQLYDMFVAQIKAAVDTYTGNIHPFARIFIRTPVGHESQWLEIARGMLRERNAEHLEKYIYFVPNVVNDDDVDAEKHRLALSLVGGIETYASHAVMDRECPRDANSAIITRFNPGTDTDDSYAKDVANGAKIYIKRAKPDLLWWVELQDAMKLYKHMSTIFNYFRHHIKYMYNVHFYTIG